MKLYKIGNILSAGISAEDAIVNSGLPPAYIEQAFYAIEPAPEYLMQKGWSSGCTPSQFKRIGVDAAINIRAGEKWRNSLAHNHKIEKRNIRNEIKRLRSYGKLMDKEAINA